MLIQDKLNKLRNKRGFTLVELMIVVAIIGVLSALAIYGVRKYLTNAKTAEGRMSLGRISKDAEVAYERETMPNGVVTLTNSVAIAHALCPTSTQVPDAIAKVSNQKYQSSPTDWSGPGWSCLKFTMTDPQYFQYQYEGVVVNTPAKNGDNFIAHAFSDLNGKNKVAGELQLTGKVQTSASGELVLTLAPTIDESGAEN
jgi:type IV pilus assembly protein PilA